MTRIIKILFASLLIILLLPNSNKVCCDDVIDLYFNSEVVNDMTVIEISDDFTIGGRVIEFKCDYTTPYVYYLTETDKYIVESEKNEENVVFTADRGGIYTIEQENDLSAKPLVYANLNKYRVPNTSVVLY